MVEGGDAVELDKGAAVVGDSGLAVSLEGGGPAFIVHGEPRAENHYNVSFYLNLADADWLDGERVSLFAGLDPSAGRVVGVELVRDSATYALELMALQDDGSSLTTPATIPLGVGKASLIRLEWWSGRSTEYADGGASLWVDGELVATLNEVSNRLFAVEEVSLGVIEGAVAGSGSIWIDEFCYWLGAESRSLILADGFESETLFGWLTPADGVEVADRASLGGELGLAVDLSEAGRHATYLAADHESRYSVSVLVDPNDLPLEPGRDLSLLAGIAPNGRQEVVEVLLSHEEGSYEVRLRSTDDLGGSFESAGRTLQPGPQRLHVEWWAASRDALGGAVLWSNEFLVGEISGLENESSSVVELRLGPPSTDLAVPGEIYFDELRAWRSPSVIWSDTFESERLDWSGELVLAGNWLEVTNSAALEGKKGLEVGVSGGAVASLFDLTPEYENHVHVSFELDAREFVLASGTGIRLLEGRDSDLGTVMHLSLVGLGRSFGLRAESLSSEGALLQSEIFRLPMENSPNRLHLEWLADQSSAVDPGRLRVWVDGFLVLEMGDLGNEGQRLDTLLLGVAANLSAQTEGRLFFDDYESWRGSASQLSLFRDRFDTGDLSGWDASYVDLENALSVVPGGGDENAFDLEVDFSGEGAAYLSQSLGTSQDRLSLSFDLEVEPIPTIGVLTILTARANDSNEPVGEIELGCFGIECSLRPVAYDSVGARYEGEWVSIGPARERVDIDWSITGPDGALSLSTAGQFSAITAPNSYLRVEQFEIGVISSVLDMTVSTLRFDAVEISRPTYALAVRNCREEDQRRGDCDDFDGG